MKKERPKTGRVSFRHAITGTNPIWSKLSARRIIASAAGFTLTVALAACGGGSGGDANSSATPTDANAAIVATAKSAASSRTVPLTMSVKMNTSRLTADSQTDRFIIKYKTGTAGTRSTTAAQSKLDRLASAFPARAHHLRRMGIGSDVVTTERKLNAKEAKAFMRAIASDPNVEYVEPDTVMTMGHHRMIRYIASNGHSALIRNPELPLRGYGRKVRGTLRTARV